MLKLRPTLINKCTISYLCQKVNGLSVRPIGQCCSSNCDSRINGFTDLSFIAPAGCTGNYNGNLLLLNKNHHHLLSLSGNSTYQKEISDPRISAKIPFGLPIPLIRKGPSIVPAINPHGSYEDPLSISQQLNIIEEAPLTQEQIIEKHAAKLVVIRRIKMNKHKLRKLRKRMKHIWAKIKLKRLLRREREFLDNKIVQIRAANKFDPKAYVAGIIAKAKQKPIPKRFQDPLMPEWYKKKLVEDAKQKEDFVRLWRIFRDKRPNFKVETPSYLKGDENYTTVEESPGKGNK